MRSPRAAAVAVRLGLDGDVAVPCPARGAACSRRGGCRSSSGARSGGCGISSPAPGPSSRPRRPRRTACAPHRVRCVVAGVRRAVCFQFRVEVVGRAPLRGRPGSLSFPGIRPWGGSAARSPPRDPAEGMRRRQRHSPPRRGARAERSPGAGLRGRRLAYRPAPPVSRQTSSSGAPGSSRRPWCRRPRWRVRTGGGGRRLMLGPPRLLREDLSRIAGPVSPRCARQARSRSPLRGPSEIALAPAPAAIRARAVIGTKEDPA